MAVLVVGGVVVLRGVVVVVCVCALLDFFNWKPEKYSILLPGTVKGVETQKLIK